MLPLISLMGLVFWFDVARYVADIWGVTRSVTDIIWVIKVELLCLVYRM
jgi:hypothetical protein